MAAIDQAVFGGLTLDLSFGIGEHFECLADDRPASSPGMCVSELRFGGVKLRADGATLCIDMAVAPADPFDRDLVAPEIREHAGGRRRNPG